MNRETSVKAPNRMANDDVEERLVNYEKEFLHAFHSVILKEIYFLLGAPL